MVLKKTLKNGLKLAERTTGRGGNRTSSTTTTTAAAVVAPEPTTDYTRVARQSEEEQQRHYGGDVAEKRPEDETAARIELGDVYVAPDGGWGWMVMIGLVVVFVTSMGPNASFTIVFGDFFEATGQAGSVTTMLNSLFNISFSLAGLVTNPLLKQFSMRSVGVIGAILFAVPNVMLALVHHVVEIAVIFFLEGIGLGLIFTICNTNFNAYFDKRRSMIMGISQAIVGLGGIVYPIGIEMMMEEYGFRGTAAITGALSLNCISAMALMRPPAIWKAQFRNKKPSKDIEQADEATKPLVPVTSLSNSRQIEALKKNEQWNSCRSLQEEETDRSMKMTPEVRVASVSELSTSIYRGRSKSLLVSTLPSDWSKSCKSALLASFTSSSLTNIRVQPGAEGLNSVVMQLRAPPATIVEAELNGVSAELEVTSEKAPKVLRIRSHRLIDSLIDFSLLRNRSFMNMCLGISFVFTSDFTFGAFLPLMMTHRGYTKADAALAITVSASAELASRICLVIFTIFVDVRPKMIFFFAMMAMSLAKFGYLYLEDTLTGTIIMVAAIGAARSWLLVPQPLVVVENVSVDQFAAAYGVYAIVSGVISVIFGPFAGLVKDWTDSFVVCQVVLLVMNSLFIIPWAMEIVMEKRKAKK